MATEANHSGDTYAVLRLRNFQLYQGGWIAAVIGDQVFEAAVGWDIFGQTGKALSIGWVGLILALPVLILSIPAGQLADRIDRRFIVITTQSLRALAIVAMGALSHFHAPIHDMYALLLFAGICRAIGWPARAAMLPSLIPAELFPNAVTWNSSVYQISSVCGSALAGPIIHHSVLGAYGTAAVAVAFMALAMFPLQPRAQSNSREPVTLKTLAAGIHFVWNTKIILATITLDLFAVLLGGAVYLFPIFSTQILHVGAVGYGWMRAAPALGGLLMGLLIVHLPPMRHAGRTMLWAVAGFGAATLVFGLSTNIWLSLAMLFLIGAFDNISVVVRHTLVQVLAPDSMRGRVSAVNTIFIGASNELGGFESGATAQWLGAKLSVVLGGIGSIAVVIAAGLIWPQVRQFGSLVDAKPLDMDLPEPNSLESNLTDQQNP